MDLYPAIDLRGGQVVRLYQGDYDQETVYQADPAEQARVFQEGGAAWIHVVDLDAARSGTATNREIVASICDAVDVPVQSGGGVRSAAAAEALVAVGVTRVVVGTAAIERPELVAELAARFRVAVGLDARAGNLAAHGWETDTGADMVTVARQLAGAGVDAFVVTEIGRDGTLEGPDLEGLASILGAVEVGVIASGGVGTVADLIALAGLERSGRRLGGAIVGRALYEGTVELTEAVAALAGNRATS
jgi:phosphoribosylformimino-5-aminoimidazole carboxamide ribotide isomerase